MGRVCGCYRGDIVVKDVFWHQLCVSMEEGRFVCSELGKGATSEVGKTLFRAADVWWRCAQYFVIASCGYMPRDNRCVYMVHVRLYVYCGDCVGVCGNVCCVAAVVVLVYGKCECFAMQMLDVCVLCTSCGSSQ